MTAGITALVLAGQRAGASDPMAVAAGVSHKALVSVGGVPMLLRVVAVLRATPGIARIVVAIESPRVTLAGLAGLDGVLLRPTAEGPAATAARVFAEFGTPLLVTTADHALLTPAMVAHFLSAAPIDAAVSVAVAGRETVLAEFPGTRRTWLSFRDGAMTGCNLFLLSTSEARGALAFWQNIEAQRKRPLAMVRLLGPWSLLLFLLDLLNARTALATFGRQAGTTAALVDMPFGAAAIDVDKPDDLTLVEAVLRANVDKERLP